MVKIFPGGRSPVSGRHVRVARQWERKEESRCPHNKNAASRKWTGRCFNPGVNASVML